LNTCIWITGRPGSGKTSLLTALREVRPELIGFDADAVRGELYPQLGFTDSDRWVNVRVHTELAATTVRAGADCVVAMVSPLVAHRDHARERITAAGGRFVEVQLHGRQAVMWKGTDYEDGLAREHRYDTRECKPDAMACQLVEDHFRRPARQLFVGRWQPFHAGHETIIRQALENGPVAVGVRTTSVGSENPHSAVERIQMIRAAFPDDDVVAFAMPDIDSIHYGRDVGYRIVEHDAVPGVSGAKLRKDANESS
jgi:cytidyltransferase-like protein